MLRLILSWLLNHTGNRYQLEEESFMRETLYAEQYIYPGYNRALSIAQYT